MRQRRVEGGEHTVEEGRIERPLVSVDGKEIEILDDGAKVVLVRPEGERERLIVEFEGTVFFRAQALQDGQIDAIGLPSQFGTEFGRTLFSVVVDEDRHIFVVTAPFFAGRRASCGCAASCVGARCCARTTASYGGASASCCGASSSCAAVCLRCRATASDRAGRSRCRGAASGRGGCLRCSVVVAVVVVAVVVAVKLFHSENVFVAFEFLNSLVNVCFRFPCASALSQHHIVLEKTTCCFRKNDVLF